MQDFFNRKKESVCLKKKTIRLKSIFVFEDNLTEILK